MPNELEKCCENCMYYDTYRKEQPCCGCVAFVNWEEAVDNAE